MSRLLITPEDRDFIVFDLDSETITHAQGQTDELNCLHLHGKGRNTYRPFGITEDQHHIYIASNDRLGQFKKDTYEFVKLIDVPLWINTHQVLLDGETLYTCNTAIDTIGIYHPDYQKQLSINYMNVVEQKLTPRYADELDSRHVNTLHNTEDRIYFVRHNRNVVASDIGFFDKGTLEPRILISVGRCCHGIRIVENMLYTLSTATGELLSINLNSLNVEKFKLVDPEVTFLRGLDYADGKLVVGCSVNFKSNQLDKSCYIIVIDMENISYKNHVLDGIKVINDLKFIT